MNFRLGSILILLILILNEPPSFAQKTDHFSINGNARFAYLSNSDEAPDHFRGTSYLRVRFGGTYNFNYSHSFNGRLATTQSSNFDPVGFQIWSDSKGLNPGHISFDEFYYRYTNSKTDIKLGRFQHSVSVLTNSKRSHFRFQSGNTSIHWTDGIFLKRKLGNKWSGEVVAEYQPKNHVTYAYRDGLNFSQNTHNFATYLGLESRPGNLANIIQRGIGIYYAPNAYKKVYGYSFYLAIMSRIVFDFPKKDALKGGSFRIAGEAGQNLNASFENGSSLVVSAGIHNYASRHQLMIEFAKTDPEWLSTSVYAPNTDELEIRYRFYFTKKFNIDFRYRIRDSRNAFFNTNYNFFARATYFL